MDFANSFQSLRKKANLSQENVAERLHISRQAVSKWETGQSTPDIDTCLKLCEVLNVTPDRLLLGTEPERQADPQTKRNQPKTLFIISSFFWMLVCICGTILLVCNLYNGEIFEPNVHTQAIIMIWGSLTAFIASLLYHLRKNKV